LHFAFSPDTGSETMAEDFEFGSTLGATGFPLLIWR
jgi:hypothetical protein